MKKAFHRNLPGHKAEEQRKLTIAKVPDILNSWTHGDGAETIHTLTAAFGARAKDINGKPLHHELYLGMDLRVLGDSMEDIRAAVKRLHKANVTIIDLTPDASQDMIDMLAVAQARMRWNGDRRQQRRKGAKGGTAKGNAMEAKRNAILARDIVLRMMAHPKLTVKDCAGILGSPFSESSLRRNY